MVFFSYYYQVQNLKIEEERVFFTFSEKYLEILKTN